MPKDGDSLVDMAAPPIRAAALAATEKKQLTLPARPAAALQVNADDCAWVDALCTPHPVATFVNKIAIADDYKLIPRKTYIRAPAYENSAFDQAMIVRKEDPSWRTYTVPCGHRIMIDMPDRLVEILLG